jgi:hypothetical protein
MKTPPLQEVKSRFGEKAKLVAAVQALATEALWLDRVSDEKGLAKVSNTKLLKLHSALTRAKAEFGSRAKLITAVLLACDRTKDSGYQSALEAYPVPRLLDLHDAAARRAAVKASAVTPAPVTRKRKARSKKAKLKAAA